MCLKNKIQQTLAEIAERQERLAKLQSLEQKQKTNPTMQALYDLLEMYREVSPLDMPDLIAEITAACSNYQKSIKPQIELEELSQELEKEVLTGKVYDQAVEEELALDDDEPKEEVLTDEEYDATDAVKTILRSHGFFMPDLKVSDCYNSEDKYEHYQGWAIYYTVTDKAGVSSTGELKNQVVDIGLDNPSEGFWTADADSISDDDSTFPQNFTDHDAIIAWTRKIIDEVVAVTPLDNLEVPGQQALPLEFPEVATEIESDVLTGDEYDAAVEEELALDDDVESEPRTITVKSKDKKWTVEITDNSEVTGYVSFLFQTANRNEGFTHRVTTEGLLQNPGTWSDHVERILGERSSTTVPEVELTALQKLLLGNSNFTFEELGVSVALESIIAPADDTVDFESEEVRITVTDATGNVREFFEDAQTFVYQKRADNIEQAALGYANHFLSELKKEAGIKEKILPSNQQSSQSNVLTLNDNDERLEKTDLQKLLENKSEFVFENLGAKVKITSEFCVTTRGEEPETVENANFTITDLQGARPAYRYYEASGLKEFQQYAHPDTSSLEGLARDYAEQWVKEQSKLLKEQPITDEPNALDFPINTMGVQVQVYPQYAGDNMMGVTFRFLSLEEKGADGKPKVVYSKSLLAAELGDRNYRLAAVDLIQKWQAKEAERLEKLANPYAKEEDKFVELVKITNCVGYLKQRGDKGEILAGYVAFSNKKTDGSKTETQAKARAQKWADFLKGFIQFECLPPRIAKRMVSDNVKQPFAYEIKIIKPSIGQLVKLAEEDLSLLPLELEENQFRFELVHSELKSESQSVESIKTDKESLTDNEIKIVELIRAALSKFDAEAVQEINSAEVPELVRNKVWESLSEIEQKVYELLLKLEFTQAPDFSAQTPEFITKVDGKQGKSVFLSLRKIDGETRRVWRYQRQTGDGGYPSKEAAAVAAWLQ